MQETLSIGDKERDVLLPMHLRVARSGHIVHVGPTLAKLRTSTPFVGRRLLEVFELRRPRLVRRIEDLCNHSGQALQFRFRDAPQTDLKGVLVNGSSGQEFVINLSFGISVVDAVRDYRLHGSDFAPTDLTTEMLYLVEAKSAMTDESLRLTHRLQAARVAAEEQAFTDTLTGLKNRRALDHVLERYTTAGRSFGVIHLDLDYFKDVNDTLGHAAGDCVLQEVAAILVQETRDTDTLVRAGGDEFTLILPDMVKPKVMVRLAERLIRRLEQPIPFGETFCRISGSAGIAVQNETTKWTAAELLQQSDTALYASKNAGRARATVFSIDLPKLTDTVSMPTI